MGSLFDIKCIVYRQAVLCLNFSEWQEVWSLIYTCMLVAQIIALIFGHHTCLLGEVA